jgi:TonB-dependent receptor
MYRAGRTWFGGAAVPCRRGPAWRGRRIIVQQFAHPAGALLKGKHMSNGGIVRHGVRTALMSGVCVMAMAMPAAAQQSIAANDQVESVTVTGLISSLQKNLDVKRDSLGLVDSISAEDIGKFPDSDIAAALQHVPGVTVSRGATSIGGVPTSTGNATQITVRGFGPAFNETLYDGRKMSSATGRSYDFSAVSSDFISQMDVLKSPDASLSSGAIGATVNIKYPKPFDHPGLNLVGAVSATVSPEMGNPMPNADVLFSDTFDNDRFGILVDAAYTSSRIRGNHVNIQGWEGTYLDPCQRAGAAAACGATLTPDAKPAWFIQDYGLYQETTTDTRYDGRLALQWKPVDSILVTVDDNYSRDTLHAAQYGYSVWFNSGSLRDVDTNKNGTITSFVQPNTPTDFQSQINGSVIQNNMWGANVKWQANDRLSFMLDAAQALSQLNPGGQLSSIDVDVGYGPSTPGGTNGTGVGIVLPGGHNLPYPSGIGPNGDASRFINNGLIGSHVLPIGQPNRTDKVQQLKLEGEWDESDNLKVVFGYQYVGDHDNSHTYDDFANNDWQAYAGYGPASNNNGTHGVALPQDYFTRSFSTSDFVNGWGGNGLPSNVLVFNPYQVLNYLQGLGNPQTKTIPGFNVGCCTPPFDGVYRTALNVGSYQQIIENSNAAYISVTSKSELAGMPLRINVGLRQEFTNLTAIGIGQQPIGLTVQPSDHTAFVTTFGPQSLVTGKNDYQYLLPNFDATLSLTDDLQVRFNASRTLTRPPLGQITPVLNVPTSPRVGALTASGGNPQLMPYLSDSVDLGAEWYYAQNSYASVDVFNKNVTNFIVQGTKQDNINGVIDPTTGAPAVFTIASNVNGPTANVYGAEFAVQHVFDDTGWGFQANATVVGTNKPYDPTNITISGFAVTGLADSANLVGFYDKDGFQARLAVTWQDASLVQFGQAQNGSKFGTEPTFVNASTIVDFSTSYDFTEHFNVYFTANNLTDANYSTHGRFTEQVLDVVDYGRRFTLGLHYKL